MRTSIGDHRSPPMSRTPLSEPPPPPELDNQSIRLDSLLRSLDVANMLHIGARTIQACAATWPHHPSAAMEDLSSHPDTLSQLLCYYLFLNTAPLFAQHPSPRMQLLGSVTPVLACIAHEDPCSLQHRLPAALSWLQSHVPSAWLETQQEQPVIMCIRVPHTIGAIALDLDDTMVMHTLLPGFKIVFSFLEPLLTPTHPPLLKAMLSNAAPHLAFLRSLANTMRSTHRPLFVTSYASAAWVHRAVSLLLGDAVPLHHMLCRSDTPSDDAEVVDKNIWLTVVQRVTGLDRQRVLLVDDSRRNVRAACAAGFLALQVDRGEGLHLGSWGPVCRALWQRSEEVHAGAPDECGALSPRGFEAAVDAELSRVEEVVATVAEGGIKATPDAGRVRSVRSPPADGRGRAEHGRRRAAATGSLRRRLLSMLQGGGRAPAVTNSLCAALDAYDSAFAKRGEADLGTPSELRLRLGAGEQRLVKA